jgi:hypothetical protein
MRKNMRRTNGRELRRAEGPLRRIAPFVVKFSRNYVRLILPKVYNSAL